MPVDDPRADGPQWERPSAGPPPAGQWAAPTGPPQQKGRGGACLWGCVGALAAAVVAVIVVVVLVVAAADDDGSTTSAPTSAPTDAATEKAPQGEKEPQGERADLVRFQLDDRSVAGLTDVWVVWTIKNSSSEKSDYSWEWEAVDASGTRLENGTEWETAIQPGQTAQGDSPTTLNSANGVKLNITGFNRTAG